MPEFSATATARATPMVRGMPTTTKLMASGLRRSRLVKSVKLMVSEASTGPAMKTRNSTMKGRANPQAARVWRRRMVAEPDRAPPSRCFTCLGTAAMSVPQADGAGLALDRLGGVRSRADPLEDLLRLGVDHLGDLLPSGHRGRGLGVLELGVEHLQQRVGGEGAALPGGLDGRQVLGGVVPALLGLGPGQPLDELPGAVAVLGILEHGKVAAANERGAGLVLRHDGQAELVVGDALVLDQADVPRAREERPQLALGELRLDLTGLERGRLGELLVVERLLELQRLCPLRGVEGVLGWVGGVVDHVAAGLPDERGQGLPGATAGRLEVGAVLGPALVLQGLDEGLELLPGGRGLHAGLGGQVLAVVQDPGVGVPGDPVRGALHCHRVPGALEEGVRLGQVGRDRVEAAAAGELAHPGGAEQADVGGLAAGDGGGNLVMGAVPGHGRHLDGGVRVLLLEGGGQLGQQLALGAHGPDGDLALGWALGDRLGLLGGAVAAPSLVAAAAGQGQDGDQQQRPDSPSSGHRSSLWWCPRLTRTLSGVGRSSLTTGVTAATSSWSSASAGSSAASTRGTASRRGPAASGVTWSARASTTGTPTPRRWQIQAASARTAP